MEVPVAVPLRMPSSEERRRNQEDLERGRDSDEMDIGALISSAPAHSVPQHDLLGLSPPSSQIPSAQRLGMPPPHLNFDRTEENGGSMPPGGGDGSRSVPHSIKSEPHHDPRPNTGGNHRSRVSYETGLVGIRFNRSWDTGRPRRGSHSLGFPSSLYNDDDDEGDLGYSAVTGSEGARRRVITERLEAVKSRNPVFTWC